MFLLNSPDPDVYSMSDGIVREDGKLPLDAVIALAEEAPFWSFRGKAIESYAQLEQALCSLFAICTETKREIASIIFFKVTNSQARNAIIEKVVHQTFGSEYNPFLNSYLKELRNIDIKRNEIVHWSTAAYCTLDAKKRVVAGLGLIPPSYWANRPADQRILPKDLVEFDQKCSVFARLCIMFHSILKPPEDVPLDTAWHDIFQQPLVYPLPEGHLLNQRPQVPDTPPQSSQA